MIYQHTYRQIFSSKCMHCRRQEAFFNYCTFSVHIMIVSLLLHCWIIIYINRKNGCSLLSNPFVSSTICIGLKRLFSVWLIYYVIFSIVYSKYIWFVTKLICDAFLLKLINQCIECRLILGLISWANSRVYLKFFNFKDHHKILLKLEVTLSKYQHVSNLNRIYLFISSIIDQTHAHRKLIWDSMTIHILSFFLYCEILASFEIDTLAK